MYPCQVQRRILIRTSLLRKKAPQNFSKRTKDFGLHNIELSSRAESEMQLRFIRTERYLVVVLPADCSNDLLLRPFPNAILL
jgi:uncharacterized lipoprotein YbaY